MPVLRWPVAQYQCERRDGETALKAEPRNFNEGSGSSFGARRAEVPFMRQVVVVRIKKHLSLQKDASHTQRSQGALWCLPLLILLAGGDWLLGQVWGQLSAGDDLFLAGQAGLVGAA